MDTILYNATTSTIITSSFSTTVIVTLSNFTSSLAHNNDNDGTDGGEEGESLEVRARQNVVLCILGFIFNAALLAIVAVAPRLRQSAKYQLIASLSVAHMLLASVFLPLDTAMAFQDGVWNYSCELLFFSYGLQEFVLPTVSSLTLSAICLEYFFTMSLGMTPSLRRRVVLWGVLAPWLGGLAALVPVYAWGFVTSSGSFVPPCVDDPWHASVLVTLVVLFGFLPLLLLAGCLVLLLAASHCCRPPDDRLVARSVIARSEGVLLTHEMADTLFAGLVLLAFNLPFLVDFSLHVQCGGTVCTSSRRVRHALEVVRTAGAVLFPAVWLLGMEFRHGLFTTGDCCYKYCDLEVEQAMS